jgi:predicted CXXCH cytochrome family protein
MAHEETNPDALATVPPDRHRFAGPLEQWQFWVPIALVVLAVSWRVVAHCSTAVPGSDWHSPGPLADVHAVWDAQCSACHDPGTPVTAANWLRITHAADARCKACHAGADHHQAEKSGERPGCTACHREHRGREASLLRVPDEQCTSCHANLGAHVAEGTAPRFRDVSRFDDDRTHHPEFAALTPGTVDPGRLKFNHKFHMTPGLRRIEGAAPFTLGRLDENDRGRYRRPDDRDDGAAVHLTCASCHQLDGRDATAAPDRLAGLPLDPLMPARSPGVAMLPVVYEKHCQTCHPLTIGRHDADDPHSGSVAVRHRLQPPEIRKFLDAQFVAESARERPPRERPARPEPGQPPNAGRPAESGNIAGRVARAERELYLGRKTCGECHFWERSPAELPADDLSALRVVPTGVKPLWLEHSRFSHASHRLLDCRACHARADASVENKDVLLPGIDTCLSCHAPRRRADGSARHDCVECHRYHDGDHPLTGKGSSARAGESSGTRTVPQFLGRE